MQYWGEKRKATNHSVKMPMITKKQLNHIQWLTLVLPQNFETESLTYHTLFMLACPK